MQISAVFPFDTDKNDSAATEQLWCFAPDLIWRWIKVPTLPQYFTNVKIKVFSLQSFSANKRQATQYKASSETEYRNHLYCDSNAGLNFLFSSHISKKKPAEYYKSQWSLVWSLKLEPQQGKMIPWPNLNLTRLQEYLFSEDGKCKRSYHFACETKLITIIAVITFIFCAHNFY